jgi:hypothetical protein
MSMPHTPERRRIPGLDDRWSIDQSGQVYGPRGMLKPQTREQAAKHGRKRLRDGALSVYEDTVEWLWYPVRESNESKWMPASERTRVASTGRTLEARGNVEAMWFSLHSDQNTPDETEHLLHGPSVAALVFKST